MRRTAVLLAAALLACAAGFVSAAEEEGFTPLFNGKDLSGWTKHGGGATYRVEGDAIVGQVGPGANTFLCTDKTYGDFVLAVDVKLDVPGNSGIQLRSHVREQGDRVFGYQCEIDPSERAWSGGIYDEGRRGWLDSLAEKEEARKAFKLDDWNQFKIEARGPRIRTWINGVPCADLLDTMDLEGHICLQVHQGKAGQIRWRNIRIKDLGESQWKPVFNGRDLAGWKATGGGEWKVADGVLRGAQTADERRHGLLLSDAKYADFALRLKFKAVKGNSGLYFRAEPVEEAVGVHGFQAEIDPANDVGGLYETGGRAWVVQPKPEDVTKFFKPGEWNEMSVVALGRRVVVLVNGTKTAELADDPGRTEGYFGLQLHGSQEMDVQFEKIELMEMAGE